MERALQAGVSVSWVTADEAYGLDFKYRRSLEEHRLSRIRLVGGRIGSQTD
ncbi:hypothetical protein GCM10009734_34590 [Nonomuraea bangladeshensis]